MQSLSLKIILNDGAVTRVIKFPARTTGAGACRIVQEKVLTGEDGKDFGLFLPSADDDLSGLWLEEHRQLSHYLLRDGDSLHYRSKVRTVRLRTLDGAVKTMQVDESQPVESLMMSICARLGITNYEEYGLCREDEPEEVVKPMTGTLTLKRKPKTREKDLAMDQLSKKLKTDDNVQWLEQHKTLRESLVPAAAALLLQRRLFYSDRVDARDPVQLGLLFAQARGALLAGRHPVPEATAVELAGMQCQVQFGDHRPDKHKPGFIEDLREFLPENYVNSRGIEKKILKEHKKHAGTSEIEAKFLYTKTVRDLPTYGVTFFLVKEILQGKKKLVPRLLGISAHSVLRMDETTKEVLNEWKLTQVKTYKAGKGELFTLNFGDYSDKEYCVKTNDAYRIRDILQAYIDLIRKKTAAPFNTTADDIGAIYTATVESGKGNVMEVVSHSAGKAVETSYVGPSRIFSYEHGSPAQAQGAQIMTAQQVIVLSQQHNQQAALAGGVALRNAHDMSAGTVRRLNDLNGHAVKIVQLLTEPHPDNVTEAKKTIEGIEEGMPELVAGVKQCIEKQPDEPARQKLTLELLELQESVAQLITFKSPAEAQQAGMRVADLTTQMYFALDPRTRRRSALLRLSRNSFIDDERTQATLQRASLVSTVAGAGEAIDAAKDILNKNYEGKPLDPKEVEDLERSSRDKLAKLNAAIALFSAAHSDPKNIDYAAAVNAMNTIKELMPELAKDVQALDPSRGEDLAARQGLLELCDAAARVCRHTGCDDRQKLHDAANDYAKKSKRLFFTFSRGEHPEKQDEILSLAEDADEKARLLLSTADELASSSDDPAAETLRAAARRCGHAAQGLRACAQLTATSIHEPHCRSALSAAAEDLSSSAQALASACRPLLEDPQGQRHSDAVKQQTADLLQALARLNNAYGDLGDNPECGERERRRLRFAATRACAQAALDGCNIALNDEEAAAPVGWLGDTLPLRLAQLDAAVASLVVATKDSENPDYAAAEVAMATIQHLMPGVVNDVKWYSGNIPEARGEELLTDLRALGAAARALAAGRLGQEPNEAVAEFAKASGKLTYVFDRSADPRREHLIIDLAKSSCEKTSELLSNVYGLADAVGGPLAAQLDAAGADAADAAQAVLSTALVTAPTSHIPASQSALARAAQQLCSSLGALAAAGAGAGPAQARGLAARRQLADDEIQKLLAALNNLPDDHVEIPDDPVKQKKRVRFAFSLSQTGDAVDKAEMEIDKPVTSQTLTAAQAQAARLSLADKLAALNAAIASLAAATQDRSNPDFEAAEKATATIQQLLPRLVEETKALSTGKDEAERRALLEDLRALCTATKELSSSAAQDNAWVQASPDAVARYSRAAGKLSFICTPRGPQTQDKEKEVLDNSQAVCDRSQVLLAAAVQATAGVERGAGAARAAAGAAQALRDTAQLTSSSLASRPCRAALLRAASALSAAVARLDEACRRPGQGSALAAHRQAFDDAVEELMRSIRSLEDDTQDAEASSPEQEKRRLKFVATRKATQDALDHAAEELAKQTGKSAPLAPPQAQALQLSLSDRLATLNAAIAALLAATRDAEKLDYEAAESASATIQELMPDLVKDAKTLSSGKDAATRDSLLETLRALCEATRALSSGEYIGKEQELHDAVKKFTNASGQLVYTFNPRADSAKEDQIIELSKSTCQRTSELLAQVYELVERADGEQAEDLDARGAKVADAAQALLTTAEITAPCISSPLCQSSLLTALDGLSAAVQQLAAAPAAGGLGPGAAGVEDAADRLREAIRGGHTGDTATEAKRERLRFTNSLASTKAAIDAAEKGLDEPSAAPASPPPAAALRRSLADKLAALNAAIHSLVAATRDQHHPDYAIAESASTTIRELMPDIVRDTKLLSGSQEPESRGELLAQIRALCDATRRLGAGAGLSSPEELNEAATQFSLASGKLTYAFRPLADQDKAHQIMESCTAACMRTSEMLQHVHTLSAQGQNDALDKQGAVVSDAARALLTTAQLTAHSTHSPPCRAALLAEAEGLRAALRGLQAVPGAPAKAGAAVDTELDRLKALLEDVGTDVKVKSPPAVPARSGSARRAPAGAGATTQQFLDMLRKEASTEASHDSKSPEILARAEAEKRAKSTFNNSVEDARKSISTAQADLLKYLQSESKPRALDDAQIGSLNKHMEHRLARANAAAAHLLACRDIEKPDYMVASKCVNTLSDLLPTIVTDAKTLGDVRDKQGRQAFLDDTLGLCTASMKLCDAAKSDKKKLTEAALAFGEHSSRLLYAVSTDVDPAQEDEVLARVRAAGDAAVRVTEGAADGRAAQRCAARATVLMYTAKLVAPSIQDPECQDTLITASKDLSTQLKAIPASRAELASELAALEQLLAALRRDVAGGGLVKRRETLVVEDTPLRRLTGQIIEYAKQNAESTERGEEERRAMAAFANQLTDALKELDLANARCKNAPHDMSKRGALEDAVYDVQRLVLQARPGAAQDTIVDLAEYLSAVSADADRVLLAAGAPGVGASAGGATRAAAAAAAQARAIRAAAERARTPRGDIDHAVQECVSRVQKLNTAVECSAEGPEKVALKREARPLNESCALLQFAAQSANATAQCVPLDEAIGDLAELGERIDCMLQPADSEGGTPEQPSGALHAARAQLAAAAARTATRAQLVAPAFTRYAAGLRARAGAGGARDERRRRLADHLKKLQERLQLLTMETSRQLQTWRPPGQQPVLAAADDVLQELDNMEAVIGIEPSDAAGRVAHEDLRRLLLPVRTYAVEGDSKQLEAKLESSATKLNSMIETITLSVGKPESLARTAHVTSESAVQLAAIARAMKTDEDPTKGSKIEEASQELCFVTYNLLKTAESVSHEPNRFQSRRRLLDACRALTDAINNLVRTSSSADQLHRECNELSRSLQLSVHPRPTGPMSYAESVAAIQAQHVALENLTSDKPMSREEFSSSLQALAAAVCADVEGAEHCAYLLAIVEHHPELAKDGVFDTTRVHKLTAIVQDTSLRVTRSGIEHQAKEESSLLSKQLSDLKHAVEEGAARVRDAAAKQQLLEASGRVHAAGATLQAILNSEDVSANKLTPAAFAAVAALSSLADAAQQPALAPPPPASKHADDVVQQTKELVTRATALMRAVRTADSQQVMTWVMFNAYSKGVVDTSERLLTCLKTNGQNAGILEAVVAEAEEETDVAFKSYVQTQVAIANKWLNKPTFKAQIKTDGETASRNVIDIGKKMATHLKEAEAEEMRLLAAECEQLLTRCRACYDAETGSLLMDRLRDLARAVDRCIVCMVVEDLEEEEPLADLETLVDAEKDEAKRKYVLERKIKDLLAHLARVTNTARALADADGQGGGQGGGQGDARELARCTDQTALFAPMLVKAAEKRVLCPTEKAVVEEYHTQLAQYSESLSRVRDLCDRAVDPMQFVQTAEEKMQRMKEESTSHQNDLQKYSNTSTAIKKLANRVIHVSMSSPSARRDPELMRALAQAQRRLQGAAPAPSLRASRLPDWDNSIAEILRATGEVESVLGGEMIFNKLPEPDQPIYNAARNLHAAVREWSARDNEIVSEAKRMAVLMAKLSDHMHADKKREVISTSKAIVAASHEVARLARKLALECTDMRIRTNLLQLCDQILTISAQLKMLSNVKKSSFGHQGNEEDIEAMNMLVGNAQNLMLTIQDTVSASFGASVKIRSQRGGPRIRWVRKNYQPDTNSPVLTF